MPLKILDRNVLHHLHLLSPISLSDIIENIQAKHYLTLTFTNQSTAHR